MSQNPTRPFLTEAACVIDHDNLCNRAGVGRERALLDIFGFTTALHKRGVGKGVVCRNWRYTAFADRVWAQLGFEVISTRSNCDTQVIISLISLVQQGCRDLVLAAGDGDYVRAVELIRRCGVRVEIWSRRRDTSKRLLAAADSVRFIDEFLAGPSVIREGGNHA